VAEQAVEDVRNVEDGTKRELGCPRAWTPPVDVAKREANPKEGVSTELQRWSGHEPKELCREAEAHERMNPSSKEAGDDARRSTAGLTGNGKARRSRETQCPAGRAYTTLWRAGNPMRGSRRDGDTAAVPVRV